MKVPDKIYLAENDKKAGIIGGVEKLKPKRERKWTTTKDRN